MTSTRRPDVTPDLDTRIRARTPRRDFLRLAALGGISVLLPSLVGSLTACAGEVTDPTKHVTIDLSTEPGALNFVYAIAQLEADFYNRSVANTFPGMLASEYNAFSLYLNDTMTLRNQLQTTQTTRRITDAMTFRFGTVVDFSDRTSTLTAASIIEDAAALGFYTMRQSYVTTPDTVTAVDGYATAAKARSDAIHDMLGTAHITLAVTSPVTLMTTLAPYYLTTVTVTNA